MKQVPVNAPANATSGDGEQWACKKCTTVNTLAHARCHMCGVGIQRSRKRGYNEDESVAARSPKAAAKAVALAKPQAKAKAKAKAPARVSTAKAAQAAGTAGERHRNRWYAEELADLKELAVYRGSKDWDHIAKELGTGRTPRAVSEKWVEFENAQEQIGGGAAAKAPARAAAKAPGPRKSQQKVHPVARKTVHPAVPSKSGGGVSRSGGSAGSRSQVMLADGRTGVLPGSSHGYVHVEIKNEIVNVRSSEVSQPTREGGVGSVITSEADRKAHRGHACTKAQPNGKRKGSPAVSSPAAQSSGGKRARTSPRGGAYALLGFMSSAAAAQRDDEGDDLDSYPGPPARGNSSTRRQERSGSVDSVDTAATMSPCGSPGLALQTELNEAEAEAEGSVAAVAIAPGAGAAGVSEAEEAAVAAVRFATASAVTAVTLATDLPSGVEADFGLEPPPAAPSGALAPRQVDRQIAVQQHNDAQPLPHAHHHSDDQPARASAANAPKQPGPVQLSSAEDKELVATPHTVADADVDTVVARVAPNAGGAPPTAEPPVVVTAAKPAVAQSPPGSPPPRERPQQQAAALQPLLPQAGNDIVVIARASNASDPASFGSEAQNWAIIAPPDSGAAERVDGQQGVVGVTAFT